MRGQGFDCSHEGPFLLPPYPTPTHLVLELTSTEPYTGAEKGAPRVGIVLSLWGARHGVCSAPIGKRGAHGSPGESALQPACLLRRLKSPVGSGLVKDTSFTHNTFRGHPPGLQDNAEAVAGDPRFDCADIISNLEVGAGGPPEQPPGVLRAVASTGPLLEDPGGREGGWVLANPSRPTHPLTQGKK